MEKKIQLYYLVDSVFYGKKKKKQRLHVLPNQEVMLFVKIFIVELSDRP